MPKQPLFSPYHTTTISSFERLDIAPFLKSLLTILSQEDPSIIGWTLDGMAFEVRDLHQLSCNVLPKYFRHGKFTSFQRQLNYFGFKKMTKSRAKSCTYLREHFTRDNTDNIFLIKRNNTVTTNGKMKPRSLSVDSAVSSSCTITPYSYDVGPYSTATTPYPMSMASDHPLPLSSAAVPRNSMSTGASYPSTTMPHHPNAMSSTAASHVMSMSPVDLHPMSTVPYPSSSSSWEMALSSFSQPMHTFSYCTEPEPHPNYFDSPLSVSTSFKTFNTSSPWITTPYDIETRELPDSFRDLSSSDLSALHDAVTVLCGNFPIGE